MKKKLNIGTITFYGLVGLIVYFAASFSMQGFLSLGSDLALNIPTFPLLGWFMKLTGASRNLPLVGGILCGWVVFQAFKKKGIGVIDLILFTTGVVFLGGVQTLASNVGGILGFCLFAWFNAVQLSSWAGLLLGFNKNWAVKLKSYIVVAYLGEFVINLLRFPPYADGRLTTFINDAQYGTLDLTLVNYQNLLLMFVSIIAVEFTFVFFVKLVHEINSQMRSRSGARQS